MPMIRGIRGAIDVRENSAQAILEATRRLLLALREANGFRLEDVSSAYFTATPDLTAEFPARAARELGWNHVPLLCAQEIAVPNALPRVIRVLLNVETALPPDRIAHAYLGAAQCLRPDLQGKRP